MKKGDIVKYSQYVKGISRNRQRKMHKFDCPETYGIVLGYSFIQEGKVIDGGYWDRNWLLESNRIKIIVIEPLTNGERYIAPVKVLEDDLTMYWPHPLNQGLSGQLFKNLIKETGE